MLVHASQVSDNDILVRIFFKKKLNSPKVFILFFFFFFDLIEGLAVGVGFGAIGKTASATFENARYVKLN